MHIIPQPQKIEQKDGFLYIDPAAKILLADGCGYNALECAQQLNDDLKKTVGFELLVTKSRNASPKAVTLSVAPGEREAYKLSVSGDGIVVTGGDEAGLFYGVVTLRQIILQYGACLPYVEIEDKPYLEHRGFYFDVTRGRVPTLDELKDLADKAAFYKLNQLQLYVQHTYLFEGLNEGWYGADPLTAEEIMEFDEYCAKRHIDCVPSVACFGHMYHFLNSYTYRHLCEIDVTVEEPFAWINRMRHHTVDVTNPDSFELVKSILDQFIPLFRSKFCNITCDETFDLGNGKSKAYADQKGGKSLIYVEFLNKIIDHVKTVHNRRPMFWSDILVKDPDFLKYIDKDVICLHWEYRANPSEERAQIIAQSGLSWYACPGTNSWNVFVPKMDVANSNIRKMVEYTVRYGGCGVLNTDWGDYGHINAPALSKCGMILGAGLSWNPFDLRDDDEFDKAVSAIEYGTTALDLIGTLREISRHMHITWNNVESFMTWQLGINHEEARMADIVNTPIKTIENDYQAILALRTKILSDAKDIRIYDNKIDINDMEVGAYGCALMIALGPVMKRHGFNQDVPYIVEPKVLADEFELWFYRYAAAWRARNKESELFRIKDRIRHICNYLRKI